jgi:beta-1,4-mannosyltransferase
VAGHARLLIAGRPSSGLEDQVLAALADGDQRIRFGPSPVPDASVPRLFAAADVVALPYRSVLTSGNVLLARALGRPVIAPATGCIPETVTPGAAILYDPGSEDGLRGAMARALSRDLPAMTAAARLAPPTEWSSIGAQTVDTYRSAVELALAEPLVPS